MICTHDQQPIPIAKGSVHAELNWKYNVIGGNNKKLKLRK